MHTLLIALPTGATLLLLVPALVFAVEIALSLLPTRAQAERGLQRPAVAVLVPAHNEAGVIAATLRAILPQLRDSDRLLVVADNCDDDTSAVAVATGAEVVERRNTEHRGKGFALDFGVRHLSARAPAVLIIVDADCLVAEGGIDRLAGLCASTGRPIQARYLMRLPAGAGGLRLIAQFAWAVRNEARPRGLLRVGLPCQLMGSGMAFPWRLIADGRLASGHLVEDLELGLGLAAMGHPPLYCPSALVSSVFPASVAGVESQRRRWEHGHLSILVSQGPRLVRRALMRGNISALALALDLLVPPVAMLSLLSGAIWLLDVAVWSLLGSAVALWCGSILLGLMGMSVCLAWLRVGREIVSPVTMILAGVYAFGKIPLYARFLVARQVDWVRSRRDGEGGDTKPQ